MRLRTAVAALAGAACALPMAGVLMAGPAVAAPGIAPRDGTTVTALSLSAAQVAFGQEGSEVLTVSVNDIGGQGGGGLPPIGLVRVLEGSTEVCRSTIISVGAQCSLSGSQLTVGPHSLTAVYNGDGRNNPSASVPLLLTVVKGQATPSLSLSPDTTSYGQESAVDMTVGVAVAGPAATGTVDVTEESTVLCSVTLPAGGGPATCHVSNDITMGPGVNSLVASYRGDDNYNSARSEVRSLTVGPDSTTTVVTPSASSLSVSQEDGAQISYAITPAAAIPGVTPTGRVSIAAGGPSGLFPICSQQISGTTGSCALTAGGELPPGTYQVSAFYFGDGAFGSSRSDEQTFTITPDPPAAVPTSTTLALSAAKVTFGHEQDERLSVQVNPQSGSGTPAGLVTVQAGSTSVCTITLSGGTGSCALGATKLRPGKYQLTASYAGSTGFQASASAQQALTVAAEPTATTMKLSAARVRVGHEQSEHLSVQVNPQFSGTPTGKVMVRAGSLKICVITVKNGKGTCTLKARQLRAGTYHLAAGYAAAAPYAASTSARKTLTVIR